MQVRQYNLINMFGVDRSKRGESTGELHVSGDLAEHSAVGEFKSFENCRASSKLGEFEIQTGGTATHS